MRALVLSGGGLFGAWQVGAWSVASQHFAPDLIVGASIGAVNAYLIAAEVEPSIVEELWRNPDFGDFRELQNTLQKLTKQYPVKRPLAITVTDLRRMKMSIYRDQEITWRHLAASCAIPLVLPRIELEGVWYSDGGLLNVLPVWAAVESGATDILGMNVLARFPSKLLAPAVIAFRCLFGNHAPLPAGVQLRTIVPSRRLGGVRDTLHRSQANIDRWIALGERDATETFVGSRS